MNTKPQLRTTHGDNLFLRNTETATQFVDKGVVRFTSIGKDEGGASDNIVGDNPRGRLLQQVAPERSDTICNSCTGNTPEDHFAPLW